jgi:elongation factor G
VLPSINIPPPVFVCAIEPQSTADEKALEAALGHLIREDPSLHVRIDEETGQRLISGMGELHLEIVHRKLVDDFRVFLYYSLLFRPCVI